MQIKETAGDTFMVMHNGVGVIIDFREALHYNDEATLLHNLCCAFPGRLVCGEAEDLKRQIRAARAGRPTQYAATMRR
jgi:hypothetical protein